MLIFEHFANNFGKDESNLILKTSGKHISPSISSLIVKHVAIV